MKRNKSVENGCYAAGWGLILLMALLFLGVGYFHLPMEKYMPLCIFRLVTGYYCPGCGGTRAVFAFFSGEFLKSFLYHPIVLYSVGVGGWFMVSQTIERVFRGRIKIAMYYRDIYLWIALGIVVLNCLLKNAILLFCKVDLLL